MSDDETRIRDLLQDKAGEVEGHPRPPGSVLKRARLRRAGSAALALVAATAVVTGAVLGVQAAGQRARVPVTPPTASASVTPNPSSSASAFPGPTPSGSESPGPSPSESTPPSPERFPGIWPVANNEGLSQLSSDVGAGRRTYATDPEREAAAFAQQMLLWEQPSVTPLAVTGPGEDSAAMMVSNPAFGAPSGQTSVVLDLRRLTGAESEPLWVITRAQSGLMDVRCPSPRQDTLLITDSSGSFLPQQICGDLSQPPAADWTVTATLEYAGSELQPSEAQQQAGIGIRGQHFGGMIELTHSFEGDDVALKVVLTAGDGSILGMFAERLQAAFADRASSPADLPAAVQRTYDALLAAAHAFDYEAVRQLIPDNGLSFCFCRETNAIGYWKRDGFRPLLTIDALLRTTPGVVQGKDGPIYAWPAVATLTVEQFRHLTPEQRADLQSIYKDPDAVVRQAIAAGGYIGWRLGIAADGTWVFFLAGD
jgi:hypothetical protein